MKLTNSIDDGGESNTSHYINSTTVNHIEPPPMSPVAKLINSVSKSIKSISKLATSTALDEHINNHNSNIVDPFNQEDGDYYFEDIVDDEGILSNGGGDSIPGSPFSGFGGRIANTQLLYNINNNKKSELIKQFLEINSENNKSNQSIVVDHMDYSVMESPSLLKPKESIEILKDLSFYLKPGMMVLLLGGPSSGVSTLFKCLTNRIPKRGIVNGDILFNNEAIKVDTHHSEYIFVQQADHHIPTLTVRETLDFSIKCQSNLDKEKKKQLSDTILSILGISHVADTFLGNQSIRGVSGGQKKRTSIAIELVKGAKAIFMDQSTSGLDSTSAFELLKSVEMISKIANVPALISLLQPSPEIFELFTHIMMLKDGEITFFGERDKVFDHFASFGLECNNKQNPTEFLSSIYHLAQLDHECQLKSPGDFVIAYKQSDYYKDCLIEVSQERLSNRTFSSSHRSKGGVPIQISTTNNGIFQLPLFTQIILNLQRVFLMTIRDRAAIASRVVKSSLLGLLIGTLFFQLDSSQKSANLIPSLSFFLLTFVVFGSLSGVGQMFQERPIFYDQKMGKYYKPIAYFLAGFVSDLLWNGLDVIIFSCISYFLIGLNGSASRFLFFLLEIYILDCLVNRVSKMVSIYSPNATIASTIAPLYFSLFLLMAGYLIQRTSIPVYWRWMHYISPFKWVFESILINQLEDQLFTCQSDELMPPIGYPLLSVPYPQGYSNIQVCPITKGTQVLIAKGINTDEGYKYLSIYIILGMYLLFSIVAVIGLYWITFDQSGSGSSNKKNTGSGSSHGKESVVQLSIKKSNHQLKVKSNEKCYLTFKNLTYKVMIKKKIGQKAQVKIKRTLLDNVNGYIKPGQMIALMGSSGAGKSTLLDILANRKDQGIVSGEILLNGKPRDKCFNRYIAYVEQEDTLPDYQTVKEAITFSALLRLPNTMTHQEKLETVEYVLDVLELNSISNTLIGKPDYGITQEQRKRVNIGIEMTSLPEILFLDEPTTGLDSISAELIMKLVKKVALDGRSVICTIHQPSESIFRMFDAILLLTQGGYTAYFGELGPNCRTVLSYCSDLGFHCPNGKNPADFLLDFSASFDSAKRLALHDKTLPSFGSRFKNDNPCFGSSISPPPTTVTTGQKRQIDNSIQIGAVGNNTNFSFEESDDDDEDVASGSSTYQSPPTIDIIDNYKLSQLSRDTIEVIDDGLPFGFVGKVFKDKHATSLGFQFIMLLFRFFVSALRRKNLIFARIGRSLLLSAVTGTLYLQLGNDQTGVMDRISFIFFTSTFASISCLSNIPSVFEDRFLFYHELNSNTYRHFSYILAMILSDLPFTIFYSMLFSAPIYWIVGLQDDGWKFLYFILVYYLYVQVMVSFSQLLGMSSPSLATANEIAGISFSIFSLFAGFIIKKSDIPSYYKWLNVLSITRYLVESLTVNEMTGYNAKFHCTKLQLVQVPIRYTPINGTTDQTKLVYQPFCPITYGDQVLHQFDLKDSYKYKDAIVLGSLVIAFLFLLLLSSRFLKFKK